MEANLWDSVEVIEFTEHPVRQLNNTNELFEITHRGLGISPDFKIEHQFSHFHYCIALLDRLSNLSSLEIREFLDYQEQLLHQPLNWFHRLSLLVSVNEFVFEKLGRVEQLQMIRDGIRLKIESVHECNLTKIKRAVAEFLHTHYDRSYIKQHLDQLCSYREKMNFLSDLEVDYHKMKKRINLELDLPIEQYLSTEKEATKLEAATHFKASTASQEIERIKTNLSIPQLALFFVLLYRAGLIEIKNKTVFFHSVATYFESKKSREVSWRSFRNHFDRPALTVISQVQAMLDDFQEALELMRRRMEEE